ncbi:hypothetical protein PR048_005478 [Dryococelus australis]|uniref:Uncharacterized protein n=1 Tax=Dryococelus australis TaxID=614101 RepID=A0ABQ9I8V2_9NEOP|nr:hypothetical protein PR048_005478 [Dryococelus australis]
MATLMYVALQNLHRTCSLQAYKITAVIFIDPWQFDAPLRFCRLITDTHQAIISGHCHISQPFHQLWHQFQRIPSCLDYLGGCGVHHTS